jgi:hypothetical protein
MKTLSVRALLTTLAIVMLLGVFAPIFGNIPEWPYAYYQMMNWVVMIAALLVLNDATRSDAKVVMLIFGLVAIVFNPIAPIHLRADIWQLADLASAALFALSFWLSKKSA